MNYQLCDIYKFSYNPLGLISLLSADVDSIYLLGL